jgi:hypothetical protein
MARLKRSSAILDRATRRMAGMRSIDTNLEFGVGLSLADYEARIQTLRTQILTYNTMLSQLDEMAGQVTLLEQELGSYSEKMLMSVAARYGKDSLQYVQAGGTLRKRTTRRSASPISMLDKTPTLESIADGTLTNGKGAVPLL